MNPQVNYLYQSQRVQDLIPEDHPHRLAFCLTEEKSCLPMEHISRVMVFSIVEITTFDMIRILVM